MSSPRASDLTVDELRALIRDTVREVLAETKDTQPLPRPPQMAILDIPPLHLDPRHPALTIVSRQDMYDDDGR